MLDQSLSWPDYQQNPAPTTVNSLNIARPLHGFKSNFLDHFSSL